LPSVDIRGATDDLQRLITPDVDRTDRELVRVRVRDPSLNMANHHTVQVLSEALQALNLRRTEGQLSREVLRADALEVNVSREPLS
jgi:hypothetical protein